MKKLLTNWAFILASCIMVVSAFTDCAPFTTGTISNAKSPRNNYQVSSVDSAFYTSKNEVIVYYKAGNRRKSFDYKVVLDFSDSSNFKREFFSHYGTWRFKTSAFRREPKGEVIGQFNLLIRKDSLTEYYSLMKERAGMSVDDSFAVLHVIPSSGGYAGNISPIYYMTETTYGHKTWAELPVKRRFRKMENFVLLPVAIVPDVIINSVIIAGAIISSPFVLYQAIKDSRRKRKIEREKTEPAELSPLPE